MGLPPIDENDAGAGIGTVVVAGGTHACARLQDGSFKCWGTNAGGQLGRPAVVPQGDGGYTFDGRPIPTPTPGPIAKAVNVAPSANHSFGNTGLGATCATLFDGQVQCWGYGGQGALGGGDNSQRPHPEPVLVRNLSAATQVVTSGNASCALADGHVRCWGFGGMLWRTDNPNEPIPRVPVDIPLPPGHTAHQISLSSKHACAVLDNNEVACWGDNSYGQSGQPNDGSGIIESPSIVPSRPGIKVVRVARETTCALEQFGRVYCFGSNIEGLLGRGLFDATGASSSAEISLPAGSFVTDLAMGSDHACVVLRDGSVWCWGTNLRGEIGANVNVLRSSVPLKIGLPRPAVSVSAGENFTCAVLEDASVMCWGRNDHGELGQGTLDTNSNPVPVLVKL